MYIATFLTLRMIEVLLCMYVCVVFFCDGLFFHYRWWMEYINLLLKKYRRGTFLLLLCS